MFVIKNIKGNTYKQLIDYACQKCDAVMFVIRRDIYINEIRTDVHKLNVLKENMIKYTDNIRPSLLKVRNGAHWVFSEVIAPDEMIDVYFYKLDDKIKALLLENNSLYSWIHPNYPEDIAFFKGGYCWLYSVAHEKTCEIYYENDEEYGDLLQMGIQFDEKYFLPKRRRYYEDYGLDKIKEDNRKDNN